MVKKRFDYGVSESGKRVGEAHQRAKLTDAQVEEIRNAYDNGEGGYRVLAKRFGLPRSTVQDIVNMRRRNTTPAEYRSQVVEVEAEFAVRPDWWKFGL